ncbi:hypothetical protein PISL3812_00169 [Talaromyces islandicus]|uniref:Uncharacterized protein n=1 Tax=Talaromyces islandicus TaxID=28573 RepID=A0A0U1LII0_TALIS|nr:hypothetical protein PISL3812_00169 [Talaromyces islandicus]
MPPLFEPVDPNSKRYVAPCDCYDCEQSFYNLEELHWYRGRVSDEEVKQILSHHVRSATEDRNYISQRLAAFGSTLINRWKKKSRQKRQQCLQETAPDLCNENWISIRYNIKEWMFEYNPYTRMPCRTPVVRSHLLLNWLSVEALVNNPIMLLALLHFRNAYSPADWATWDDSRMGFSWRLANFDVDFSTKCVIMHGLQYGDVVDWHPVPAHRGDIIGFPKARLILEAQSHLMRTLRNIVDNIFGGIDSNVTTTSDKWKNMTVAGFSHTNEVEYWSVYTNPAFSPPPVFSISNLVSISQTRLEAEGDHLRFLQASPAYMRRHVKKPLMQGEFYKLMCSDQVGVLIADEIFYSVRLYLEWEGVKLECENVERIYNRMRDSIHRGQSLPRAFDRAMGTLEVRIINVVNSQAEDICTLMSHRPGFDRYFEDSHKKNSSINLKKAMPGECLRPLFEQDPLAWCLFQMTGRPDDRNVFDHSMLFSFLESHLAKSDSKERARLDEILYKRLSDLAAAHQILFAVRLHKPQNAVRELWEIMETEDRLAWRTLNINTPQRGLMKMFHEATSLGELITSNFCDCPVVVKQKDESWMAQSRKIRNGLELFWERMRICCKKTPRDNETHAREIREHMEVVSVNLTAEFAEEVEAERRRMMEQIQRTRTPVITNVQNEWLSTDSYETFKPVRTEPKTKAKPRPSEQPLSNVEEIRHNVSGLEIENKRLPVSKRAFEVLSLMFPTSAEVTQKGVRWDIFIHMMIDMGFSARSSGGLAVVFEKLDTSSSSRGGRIVFHRPHPSPNVDSVMLESMGKRMAKWFG